MGAVRCAGEIPLLLSFFYLLDGAEANRKVHFLAGAAHLSNDNAGVLR